LNLAVSSATEAMKNGEQRYACAGSNDDPKCRELSLLEEKVKRGQTPPSTTIAANALDAIGLSQEQINNVLGRDQTVTYIWVPPVNKAQQERWLKYYVAFTSQDLTKTQEIFQTLCEKLTPGNLNAGSNFKKGLEDALPAMTGENGEDEPLSDRLWLPLIERSIALNYSIRDIERIFASNDSTDIQNVRLPFCKSATLLDAVLKDLKIEPNDLVLNSDGVYEVKKAATKYLWHVSRGGLSRCPR
jgi:hypothetical protein